MPDPTALLDALIPRIHRAPAGNLVSQCQGRLEEKRRSATQLPKFTKRQVVESKEAHVRPQWPRPLHGVSQPALRVAAVLVQLKRSHTGSH